MNFKLKAYSQKIFSALPQGEKINYLLQTKVFKSLPGNEHYFGFKIHEVVDLHIPLFKQFNQKPLEEVRYFEFGAGWDLIQPIVFSLMGIGEITVCDIKKLVFPELVANSIVRLRAMQQELPFELKRDLNSMDETLLDRSNLTHYLTEWFNIKYIAPLDASKTPFETGHFDLIATTAVLEHVPPGPMLNIFKECRRILANDGVFSNLIDYKDHYAYFDNTISIYNFLKFSDSAWGKYNSSLHFQNRLRHSDYLKMFDDAGFDIAYVSVSEPDNIESAALKNIALSTQYQGCSLEDLAIKGSHIVAQKKK